MKRLWQQLGQQSGLSRGALVSVLVHLALFLVLLIGIDLTPTTEPPPEVEVELAMNPGEQTAPALLNPTPGPTAATAVAPDVVQAPPAPEGAS